MNIVLGVIKFLFKAFMVVLFAISKGFELFFNLLTEVCKTLLGDK